MISPDRPKIWLLADRPGWAYDRMCHGIAMVLAPDYECRVAYVVDHPDLGAWDFDLVLVCFWGETWHQPFVQRPEQVIKILSSHRWQQAEYGHLDPVTFAATHLADASTVGATSLRLVDAVQSRKIRHVPQGVEELYFDGEIARSGGLVAGWAGNAQDPCKGLTDVLEPAIPEGVTLRTAPGELTEAEMAAFYQEIDVLLVASTAEGEPRTLLEGMASGCLPITTDVGIAHEVITSPDLGWVIRRDPAAFRAALQWCSRNLDHVRNRQANVREHLRETRTWAQVAPAWHELVTSAWERCQAGAAGQHQTQATLSHPTLNHPSHNQTTTGDAGSTQDVVAAAKQSYSAHLDAVNGDGPDENTWRASCAYYDCELLPLLPEDRNVRCLDVGTGYGLLLRYLQHHGFTDLTGVELDETLCERSRGTVPGATVHHGDAIEFLRAHPGTFGCITAWDILEHFPLAGCLELLQAIRGALAPGGRVALRTPNMANVLGIYSRCMDLTHQVGFTEQSLDQLLIQAGFESRTLHVPDFSGAPGLAQKVTESRAFHARLFELQDRATPRCFDKNLVAMAMHTAAVPPTQGVRSQSAQPRGVPS